MNVYGELKRAQLEYLGAPPTAGVKGRVYWRSDLLGAFVDDGTNLTRFLINDQKIVVGTSGTAGNNVRLYRSGAAKLQFTIASDATAEGTPSTSFAQVGFAAEQYTTGTRPAASGAAVGQLVLNTTDYVLEWQDGTRWYRRFDGGTASDYQRFILPGDTAANLASLTKKAGAVWYSTDTFKHYLSTATTLLQIVNAGVGTSGQVPVNDGANGYSWGTPSPGAVPNYLLNGAFDFWQRGTSFIFASVAAKPVADRWYVLNKIGNAASVTISRVAGTTSGSKYAISCVNGGGGSGNTTGPELYQVLENTDALNFYNTTGSFGCLIKAAGNVNQVGIQFMYATSEVKLTTTIGSETLTTVTSGSFTLCQILNQAMGTSQTTSGVVGVRIRITGVSSGNIYDAANGFIVEQARMNVGTLLGNFQRSGGTIGGELLRCQRFYWRQNATEALGNGYFDGASSATGNIVFPVTMRSAPTCAVSAAADVYCRRAGTTNTTASGTPTYANVGVETALVVFTTSAASTTGFGTSFGLAGSGWFEADAEI